MFWFSVSKETVTSTPRASLNRAEQGKEREKLLQLLHKSHLRVQGNLQEG